MRPEVNSNRFEFRSHVNVLLVLSRMLSSLIFLVIGAVIVFANLFFRKSHSSLLC